MAERIISVEQLDFTPSGEVFSSPRDWRDVVIYFLLVDRFDNNQENLPSYDPNTTPIGREQGQAEDSPLAVRLSPHDVHALPATDHRVATHARREPPLVTVGVEAQASVGFRITVLKGQPLDAKGPQEVVHPATQLIPGLRLKVRR